MRHYRTQTDQKKELYVILGIFTGLLGTVSYLLYLGLS
jgi:hypothetical protein